MSATTYELIGKIINPQPVQRATTARVQVLPSESVYDLIGRMIGPPGAARRGVAFASDEQTAEVAPVAV